MICWTAARMRSTRLHKPLPAAVVLLSLLGIHASGVMRLRVCASSSVYDIREHLSTKAPYIHRVRVQGAPSVYDVPDPAGYKPLFMYLLARHGSRWPTEKRMRQINSLKHVFKAAAPRDPAFAWMHNWTSPMAHIPYLAGELHPEGEAELMGLAQRLRGRFPAVTAAPYTPRRNPIISTQVPRAAQSASAFALGFFGQTARVNQQQQQQQSGSSSSSDESKHDSSSSSVFGWQPQPVAINMLPKKHDPVLRFFECCKAYRQHEDRALRWLAPWIQRHWQSIAPGLEARMGMQTGTLHSCHVDALWQLCTFEAGLMNTTTHQRWLEQQQQQQQMHKAAGSNGSSSGCVCELFTPEDVLLLEWLEDVRLYEAQGYGAEVNYAIAAPLLADIASALTSAATAHSAGKPPLQQVRLMFAHCETLTPLASLMGLFAPGTEEQEGYPELPREDLMSSVKISHEQVEADLAEVEEVTEDLPLVVMQQQQKQKQKQGTADSNSSRGSSNGAVRNVVAKSAELEALAPNLQQQQQEEQQEGQGMFSPAKRRRLAHSTSSKQGGSSSSSSTLKSAKPADIKSADAAHALPLEQQQQQQLRTKHKHGPEAAGCSFRGGDPLDVSLLLPPPNGWLPRFLQHDGDRVWRGGRVAPLGANIVLVLFGRDGGSSSSSGVNGTLHLGDYRVRLVYNEQVIPVPGCSTNSGLDCSLQEFLQVVVGDKTTREKLQQFCSSIEIKGLQGAFNGAAGMGGDVSGLHSSSSSSHLDSDMLSSQDPLLLSRDWGGSLSDMDSVNKEWLDASQGFMNGLVLMTADGLPLLLPSAGGIELQLPVTWY